MATLSEHILEVRYKANPKVLDYRGTWAEGISATMKLKHWKIVQNRVDVYNEDNSIHAFVGFKHAGFVARDTEFKDLFPNKAVQFFRYLFSLDGFGKELYVERLGVRSTFGREYNGEFQELLDLYVKNYLSITDRAKKMLGGRLTDIGGPLNFEDKDGSFNTMCGPMKSDQLAEYMGHRDDIPTVGLYFDIDYWTKPEKDWGQREVVQKIKLFAENAWNRFESIYNLITEA